jgi:ribonuclease-3
MEEEPVMAAPDLDKLEHEQQDFIIEQEKPSDAGKQDVIEAGASSRGRKRVAKDAAESAVSTEIDALTLDDISATPREKSRDEIIAEAEAAAFAE